jgi:hypothetical protein
VFSPHDDGSFRPTGVDATPYADSETGSVSTPFVGASLRTRGNGFNCWTRPSQPMVKLGATPLHVASALSLADELEGIVTYDERLGVAAGLHGVAVVAPSGE